MRQTIRDRFRKAPAFFLGMAFIVSGITYGSGTAYAADDCVKDYNYVVDVINKHTSGLADPFQKVSKQQLDAFERRLKACLQNSQPANTKGNAYDFLARTARAQGKKTEALGHFRRSLSFLPNKSSTKKKRLGINKSIANLIWDSGNRQNYIAHTSSMISSFYEAGRDLGILWRRADAFKALGHKREALEVYLTAASLDTTSKRLSSYAEAALKLQREFGRRKSCAVLDTRNIADENFLKNINDCLSERKLPAPDRALGTGLRGAYRESKQDNERALTDFNTLMAMRPSLPVFRQVELDYIVFGGAQVGTSVAHKTLGYRIFGGNTDAAMRMLNSVIQRYEQFLATASEPGTGYASQYSWAQDKTKRASVARQHFIVPVSNWLAQNGKPAKATDILTSLISHESTSQNDGLTLLFHRAQIQVSSGDLDAAAKDFAHIISTIPPGPQRQILLRQSALLNHGFIMSKQGNFKAALKDGNTYFHEFPANWYEQGVSQEHFQMFVLRAEMAIRTGALDTAKKHIKTLQVMHDKQKADCTPCTQLNALISELN